MTAILRSLLTIQTCLSLAAHRDLFIFVVVRALLRFDGAGYSLSGTKDVLSSIASDCMVQGGECVNAVEIFWTPGERDEVLTSRDIVLDFPELIDL